MWKWLVGGAVAVGGYFYLTRIKVGDTVFFPLSATGVQAQLLALGLSSPGDMSLGMTVQTIANGQITGTVTSAQALSSPGVLRPGTLVAVNNVGPVTVPASAVTKHVAA